MSYLGFQLPLPEVMSSSWSDVSIGTGSRSGGRGQQESSGLLDGCWQRTEVCFTFVQMLFRTESISKGSMVRSLIPGNLVAMCIKCGYFKRNEGRIKV